MGIPKFFRWLSERYPLINQRLLENNEYDCFYLDMNGIIHNCAQKYQKEGINEKKLFRKIFSYTEHLFRIIKPRKLIYLAIDGVAPRAKMNQQRSRRFRSIKELEKFKNPNNIVDARDECIKNPFDSNCITPGTEFMLNLSWSFKKWLEKKINSDKEWQQGCDVIFSGAEVPGEGEHKIMNYIRKIKKHKVYQSSSLKHCLYGLDADLIMLGLAAHENHLTLLREKLLWKDNKSENQKLGNLLKEKLYLAGDEFHLLEISLLRDMLYLEFKPREPINYSYNFERIIDDFIFICMFIGNDFLPSLPHLDIAFGGLNLLVRSYKEMQKSSNGFLTSKFRIHIGRVELFLAKISAEAEEFYFFQTHKNKEMKNFKINYKKEYYSSKLKIELETKNGLSLIEKLKNNYIHGLHWCLYYYHQGCPSWNWFYPEYFPPLASDLDNLKKINITFTKGRPFEPLIQLLAVLPPKSSSFLPMTFSRLMKEKNSPILNFYPEEYKIDLNGKKNLWEGIVLLPFIDQEKLSKSVNKYGERNNFNQIEKLRNCFGKDLIFFIKKI
jgi:5'-3' exoribonuclease 1